MKETKREYFRKIRAGEYKKTHETTDAERVKTYLIEALRARYIYKSPNVRSITHICNYDGTETFKVFYNGTGDKEVITINQKVDV